MRPTNLPLALLCCAFPLTVLAAKTYSSIFIQQKEVGEQPARPARMHGMHACTHAPTDSRSAGQGLHAHLPHNRLSIDRSAKSTTHSPSINRRQSANHSLTDSHRPFCQRTGDEHGAGRGHKALPRRARRLPGHSVPKSLDCTTDRQTPHDVSHTYMYACRHAHRC